MKFVERNPQRSPEEIEFDRLCRDYYGKFGRQYVIQIPLTNNQCIVLLHCHHTLYICS